MSLLENPLIKDPDYKHKILLFDIESTPIISYNWGIWQQDAIEVKEEWYILCFAYKWLGESKVHIISLPDFKGYAKDKKNDFKVVEKLWELFNEAEVIIAHNGDNFDIKKANARFIFHGLDSPSPYKAVNTLKIARRYFKFDSNKLDYLGQYLKLGRKLPHTGKHLWFGCMDGDDKSWKLMKEYNKQDVILLEKVYRKLRSWDKTSPNMNLILGGMINCRVCGSLHTRKEGTRKRLGGLIQEYSCNNCGAWGNVPISKKDSIMR